MSTTQSASVCNERLFKDGVAVLALAGLASTAIEAQVVRWREEIGVPIDWHYVGGRAIVFCLFVDVEKVRENLQYFSPMYQIL
jgi:hypothetical protein